MVAACEGRDVRRHSIDAKATRDAINGAAASPSLRASQRRLTAQDRKLRFRSNPEGDDSPRSIRSAAAGRRSGSGGT